MKKKQRQQPYRELFRPKGTLLIVFLIEVFSVFVVTLNAPAQYFLVFVFFFFFGGGGVGGGGWGLVFLSAPNWTYASLQHESYQATPLPISLSFTLNYPRGLISFKRIKT